MGPRQLYNLLSPTTITHEPHPSECTRLVVSLGGDHHNCDLQWRVLLLQTTEEGALACARRLGLRVDPLPDRAPSGAGRLFGG